MSHSYSYSFFLSFYTLKIGFLFGKHLNAINATIKSI